MVKASQVLILVVFLTSWNSSADHPKCLSVDSVSNYALRNHRLSTLNKRSLFRCLATCQENNNCYSINYSHVTKTCELNGRTRETYPGDFEMRPEWVYLDLLSRKPPPPCEKGGKSCRYSSAILTLVKKRYKLRL